MLIKNIKLSSQYKNEGYKLYKIVPSIFIPKS